MKTMAPAVFLILMVGLTCCKNKTAAVDVRTEWNAENQKEWLSTCVDVHMSELEDGRGNPLPKQGCEIYCGCMLDGLKASNIRPKDEPTYIGTPTWKKLADDCYTKANK